MPSKHEIKAAARAICKSGRFETGEGTCALICMDQLGTARHSCRHIVEVYGSLVTDVLATAEAVRKEEHDVPASDLTSLRALLAEAKKALGPSASFGLSDGKDIRDGLMRDRICDWFGPFDFDLARSVLAKIEKALKE